MTYDRIKKKKKTGLGLVLRAAGCAVFTQRASWMFLDHDISFDGVIGVSAGAVHGASFVSGQKERSIRYYKKYCNDKRFMSFKNWLRTEIWWTSSSASMIYRIWYDQAFMTVLCGMQQCGDRESRVSGDQRYVQRCRIFPCDGISSVCVPYGRGWWNEASGRRLYGQHPLRAFAKMG